MVPWGLLTRVIGGLYGNFSPGKQPRGSMLLNGTLFGLVLAVALALRGILAGAPALGGIGFFWDIAALTLLFVLGTWLGDLLEGAKAPSS